MNLLEKSLDELTDFFDSHSQNALKILGDVLGDFYDNLHKGKSRTNDRINSEKITALIDYIKKKGYANQTDIDRYTRTYRSLLDEFKLKS